MEYYFIYSFLIIVIAIIVGRRKRGVKSGPLLRAIPALLYVCFVGFRSSSVGVDSESYRDLFESIPFQDYLWIEVGFDKLIRILYDYGLDYNSLYLASILLTTVPIYLVLEKAPRYTACAILLYIVTIPTVVNGIRQCISVGWFFYGVLFIQQRKLIPYALCMGLCLLFHYSSVILFPLYFLIWKPAKQWIYVAIYMISFVFVFLDPSSYVETVIDFLKGFGVDYDRGYKVQSLSILGFIFNTSTNIVIFYLIIKTQYYKINPALSNCAVIAFCLKNITFSYAILGRVMMYFSFFPLLMVPELICSLKKDERPLYSFFFVTVYTVGFVHQLLSPEMVMTPYIFNFKLWR